MQATISNKQIAVNTIIVYVRIILSMLIGLFSSRYTLQLLGASDFGLYNVVGGVVIMFSFISTSLSTGTIRFLNVEKGKIGGNINRVFNTCIILHIVFALILFILLEVVGTYYIRNILNVNPGKEESAMFVFQASSIVACISLIILPFQCLYTVYEKFNVLAYVEVSFAFLKLASIFLLLNCSTSPLKLYALAIALITLLQSVFYCVFAKFKWPQVVDFKRYRNNKAYRELLLFNNYNLLTTISLLMRSQGSNILINLFFGTTVNAAYAIANTVLSYVNIFIGNFDSASGPQIVQNISVGNKDRYIQLVHFTCKICMLIMILIFFPLICELEFILYLWLGDNIPEGTTLLCFFTLLIAIISSTSAGLGQLINGYGNIKWFSIEIFILYLIALVAGFYLFRNGYPAYTILLLFVVADLLSRAVQLYLLYRLFRFNVKKFLIESYVRPAIILLIMSVYILIYRNFDSDYVLVKVSGILVTIIVSISLIYLIGLNSQEKRIIKDYVRRICLKCKKSMSSILW